MEEMYGMILNLYISNMLVW